jgi:flagellar protein FlaG
VKLDVIPMRTEALVRGTAAPVAGAPAAEPALERTATQETRAPRPVTEPVQAVEMLNRALQDARRDLRFRIDDASGATVVQVIEPDSGEVIRQIPAEEILRMASALGSARGLSSLGLDDWS